MERKFVIHVPFCARSSADQIWENTDVHTKNKICTKCERIKILKERKNERDKSIRGKRSIFQKRRSTKKSKVSKKKKYINSYTKKRLKKKRSLKRRI